MNDRAIAYLPSQCADQCVLSLQSLVNELWAKSVPDSIGQSLIVKFQNSTEQSSIVKSVWFYHQCTRFHMTWKTVSISSKRSTFAEKILQ
ncbi:hypothetical protein Y1Q_0004290 [Alligator mississippiensis]|uniref:Uncharacterized protein n=1 Tax=Alligator mississippiensis TaxID=8496 RepID=A0A151MID7_ALLMI|nr:hypothetical protein Y1Q_0004290 [Alligator mississippiensis]